MKEWIPDENLCRPHSIYTSTARTGCAYCQIRFFQSIQSSVDAIPQLHMGLSTQFFLNDVIRDYTAPYRYSIMRNFLRGLEWR